MPYDVAAGSKVRSPPKRPNLFSARAQLCSRQHVTIPACSFRFEHGTSFCSIVKLFVLSGGCQRPIEILKRCLSRPAEPAWSARQSGERRCVQVIAWREDRQSWLSSEIAEVRARDRYLVRFEGGDVRAVPNAQRPSAFSCTKFSDACNARACGYVRVCASAPRLHRVCCVCCLCRQCHKFCKSSLCTCLPVRVNVFLHTCVSVCAGAVCM
eukprot:6207085-Pleurochrysis_carterae.AAC.5